MLLTNIRIANIRLEYSIFEKSRYISKFAVNIRNSEYSIFYNFFFESDHILDISIDV